MSKVLVTGGRGFLCGQIIPFLRESGVEVDIYDIADGDDIFDTTALAKRIKGNDAVIHTAAIPHFDPSKSWEEFERLNVGGTKAVLAAMKKANTPTKVKTTSKSQKKRVTAQAGKPCERIIYFSTGALYGFDGGFVEPESYPIPLSHEANWDELNLYARSKVVAEKEVEKAKGLESIVLRVNWPGLCPSDGILAAHKWAEVSWELLNTIVLHSISAKLTTKYNVFNAINPTLRDGSPAKLEVSNRLETLGV